MSKIEEGRTLVKRLVERFSGSSFPATYNETQLRTDFLNDFLTALGWDVFNFANTPQRLREVIVEEAISVDDDEAKKKPDYTLRRDGERVLFVEAKKPRVAISTAKEPAFQTRRYGWNAGLSISILTNFDKLAIYDCSRRPIAGDEVNVGRIKIYDHTEYVESFDEIYERLSRESVHSGTFDTLFGKAASQAGTEPFDQYFLQQIERWRQRLAQRLASSQPKLTPEEINFLIQRFINRVIFLRICEDRQQETYERLRRVRTYEELKSLFQEADRRYNSGLFDFIEDQLSFNVTLDSNLLISLFDELYLPHSSYNFSVVEPRVLGEIYEQFLANQVEVAADRSVQIVQKPEIAHSDGVVHTPKYIVDRIVAHTFGPLFKEKSPMELAQLRLADIACGSGIFLLCTYEFLADQALEWYQNNNPETYPDAVYATASGMWHLTLAEKHHLLTSCIYGVDIDIQAVEITRFSLLLKVLENESIAHIDTHLTATHTRALPNLDTNIQCGNSLIDSAFYTFDPNAMASGNQLVNINPFDWGTAFPDIMNAGGFDAIAGNPPYIRIQNMVRYSPREVAYYKSSSAHFTTAVGNFDKYALFIERALALVKEGGVVSYIVPHKFFKIKSGQALRHLLSQGTYVQNIIHFGVQQVFPQRLTYTCILYLAKRPNASFGVELVLDLEAWQRGNAGISYQNQSGEVGDEPWLFIPQRLRKLYETINARADVKPLGTRAGVANIFVGLQTSADNIFMLKPTLETKDVATFLDRNRNTREIEKAILRPCLLDVQFIPFGEPESNAYMIFPYHIENGRAILYTIDEMKSQFPKCWEYFEAFEESLRKRSINGGTENTWYRFGRSQSLTQFNGTAKVIWPVMTLDPKYAYDDQDVLFTGGGNGPYYALRPLPNSSLSIFYLMSVLSHPLLELKIKMSGSAFQGGYISHGKQFLERLPIRTFASDDLEGQALYNTIVTDTTRLIDITKRLSSATTSQARTQLQRQRDFLRTRIDAAIAKVYDLTPEDLMLLTSLSETDEEQSS
jgi:type I restriction-modification system DNA methylase subunit